MNQPDWWYPGYFIGLTIFLFIILALTLWGLRWGARQVDLINEEIHQLDEAQQAFEADLRARLLGDFDEQ